MTLDTLLAGVTVTRVNSPAAASCTCRLSAAGQTLHYSHADPSLAVSFRVERMPFQELQIIDPRQVRIAPGSSNEKHRHAHEAIFVVLSGEGAIQIGNSCTTLQQGDIAYVPRWVVHQCLNHSASEELVLLAITDFGFTSAVLGDYDGRTRLKNGGADAFRDDGRLEDIPTEGPPPRLDPTNAMSLERSRAEREDFHGRRIAAQYVDNLAGQALIHRAVRHPYLKALSDGTLPDLRFALVDFARHYYGYSAHFPRYLTALISRLENPDHRKPLLANLIEESGHYGPEELQELRRCGIEADWIVGIPHPDLFQRFRHALGVSGTDPAGDHMEVVAWRDLLLGLLSSGSPAEALGAMSLGTESIVRTIYQPLVAAIGHLGTLDPCDSVFFPVHMALDDKHQATLTQVAMDFAMTPAGRADLSKGMHMALTLRNSFWDWLYERALGCDVTTQQRS